MSPTKTYTPDATHITVAAEYCPDVFILLSDEFRVTPEPAEKVICPVPYCKKSILSPADKTLLTVIVIAPDVDLIRVFESDDKIA